LKHEKFWGKSSDNLPLAKERILDMKKISGHVQLLSDTDCRKDKDICQI
jgi:hypothetical protein